MKVKKLLIVIMIFTLCICVTGCDLSSAWKQTKSDVHGMVKGADFNNR